MQVPFKQGIVRYQTDNAPTPNPIFLQQSLSGNYINLVVSPDPTILNFSHGVDHEYLFEESKSVNHAWGPFSVGTHYWLFWDIDPMTAVRTFGYTTRQPTYGPNPPSSPQSDQHWFDTINHTMKVFQNNVFIEKIRVFAAKYHSGSVLQPYALGSQVGLNIKSKPGSILFDDKGDVIKQGKNKRAGYFVTSESLFSTHASSGSVVRLEGEVQLCEAVTNIAEFQLVCLHGYQQMGFASSNDIIHPIIGIVREDLYVGEIGNYISKGRLTNPNWNWLEPAGTLLFCDPTGQVTTDVPQQGSLQRIGYIHSKTSIDVDIGTMYILEDE